MPVNKKGLGRAFTKKDFENGKCDAQGLPLSKVVPTPEPEEPQVAEALVEDLQESVKEEQENNFDVEGED